MSNDHNWKVCKCNDCADLHYDYLDKVSDYSVDEE